MKRTIVFFCAVVTAMCALAVAIALTHDETVLGVCFLLFIFVGLPLFLLTLFDLGRTLRATAASSQRSHLAGVVLGIPEAMFGFISLAMGAFSFVAIYYKLVSEGHAGPGYGWTLIFEVFPLMLIWYGVRCFRRAFSSRRK